MAHSSRHNGNRTVLNRTARQIWSSPTAVPAGIGLKRRKIGGRAPTSPTYPNVSPLPAIAVASSFISSSVSAAGRCPLFPASTAGRCRHDPDHDDDHHHLDQAETPVVSLSYSHGAVNAMCEPSENNTVNARPLTLVYDGVPVCPVRNTETAFQILLFPGRLQIPFFAYRGAPVDAGPVPVDCRRPHDPFEVGGRRTGVTSLDPLDRNRLRGGVVDSETDRMRIVAKLNRTGHQLNRPGRRRRGSRIGRPDIVDINDIGMVAFPGEILILRVSVSLWPE